MKTTCKYCGIVEKPHKCSRTIKRSDVKEDKFHRSRKWTNKSIEIRERDNYLCLVCKSNNKISYKGIEVHHIDSLKNNYDKRLDNDNLISVCKECHELAESGKIKKDVLFKLVTDQEKKYI